MMYTKLASRLLRLATQLLKPKYSFDFVKSVINWQAGILGERITNKAANYIRKYAPKKLRMCNESIYRGVSFSRGTSTYQSKISSWTTDLHIAKDFMYKPNRTGDVVAFFKIKNPESKRVILNFSLLGKDKEFADSIRYYVDTDGKYRSQLRALYAMPLGDYNNDELKDAIVDMLVSQKEVVYHNPELKLKDAFLVWKKT